MVLGWFRFRYNELKNKGTQEVAEEAIKLAHNHKVSEHPHVFVGSVEHALAHIEESIEDRVDASKLRWLAVKVFERDEKVLEGNYGSGLLGIYSNARGYYMAQLQNN